MLGVILEDLTASEINLLIANVAVYAGLMGLLIGFVLMFAFIWFLQRVYERNFKMWLLQLNDEDRKKIQENLETAYKTFDELSKSNTRLFKTWYNDLMALKYYLARKWRQN